LASAFSTKVECGWERAIDKAFDLKDWR